MRKEISYKDLLIKILEGKEVPEKVIYNDKEYTYNKNTKEYVICNGWMIDSYLSDNFKGLTLEGMIHESVFYNVELLDKQEKAYLKAVIRPFRNRVQNIEIVNHVLGNDCHLRIELENNGVDYIHLPNFIKGTMYKNLKFDKLYSLEELGL